MNKKCLYPVMMVYSVVVYAGQEEAKKRMLCSERKKNDEVSHVYVRPSASKLFIVEIALRCRSADTECYKWRAVQKDKGFIVHLSKDESIRELKPDQLKKMKARFGESLDQDRHAFTAAEALCNTAIKIMPDNDIYGRLWRAVDKTFKHEKCERENVANELLQLVSNLN